MTRLQSSAQLAGMSVVALAAVGAVSATTLAAMGVLPWIEIPVSYGGQEAPMAGPAVQLAITFFLLLLSVYLPSSIRVMRLEATHRDFAVRMDDVARAYWAAHAADRAGLFQLKREYDGVRERLRFLRAHPDLEELDHSLLEVAAQMGHESRELAQIYSDEKVARAYENLALRQHEAEEMNTRIARAHTETSEIRRLLDAVEVDEDVVRSRLTRLREEISALTPLFDQDVADPPESRRARIGIVPGE